MYKRRYRKKRSNGSYTQRKVARQEAKKVIAREIETKMFDGYLYDPAAPLAGFPVTAIGANYLLTSTYLAGPATAGSPMVAEVAYNNYIGGEIWPNYIHLIYEIDYDNSIVAPDSHNTVTLALLQGKGSFIPSQITAANIFQLNNSISSPLSAFNNDFDNRFTVLKKRIVEVDPFKRSVVGQIKVSRKKLRKIYFTDVNGGIEGNQIWISVISDSTAGTGPYIRAYWRLHFKDA